MDEPTPTQDDTNASVSGAADSTNLTSPTSSDEGSSLPVVEPTLQSPEVSSEPTVPETTFPEPTAPVSSDAPVPVTDPPLDPTPVTDVPPTVSTPSEEPGSSETPTIPPAS
jgi:hypothetical protein